MKAEIDFTFRARCIFLDIRHSSSKLYSIALMHAIVHIIPR